MLFQLATVTPSLQAAISLHELLAVTMAIDSAMKERATQKISFAKNYYFNNYMFPLSFILSGDMNVQYITEEV